MSFEWLNIAKQLQSIAQSGLAFSDNKFDRERYQFIRDVSVMIVNKYTKLETEKLVEIFASEKGYPTPKVDVRGVVFREGKILLVKEISDNMWSIPGGWAEIGLTPYESTIKEVKEEAGLIVNPLRLLAILDKRSHNHPVDLFHIYKLFILCNEVGGELNSGIETCDIGFFDHRKIPPLSKHRVTKEQIDLIFEFYNNPEKETICE